MAKRIIKNKKISIFTLLLFILILLIFLFLPGQNIYQQSIKQGRPLVAGVHFVVPSPAPYPINMTGILPPDITAQGVIISDISSRVILFEKNPKIKMAPASTTKIMSAIVALEKFKKDDVLTVNTVITEGKKMSLIPGEKFTFENLLYGMLVDSANDATYTIAENYPGGVTNFVQAMNKKAQDLFLQDTNFTNPIGFEDNNHYTTAADLARLSTYALNNSDIIRIVGIPAITISDITFTRFYSMENVNQLLGKIPGVFGFKTGWTENAGECLVTTIERGDKKILIIILGSKDRFGETKLLIDWVFTNFSWQTIAQPT
ncbi:MAG: serine hydrolase [Candidatus Gottesmanbacteria bacterium]